LQYVFYRIPVFVALTRRQNQEKSAAFPAELFRRRPCVLITHYKTGRGKTGNFRDFRQFFPDNDPRMKGSERKIEFSGHDGAFRADRSGNLARQNQKICVDRCFTGGRNTLRGTNHVFSKRIPHFVKEFNVFLTV
jgi:hypothetical protein